MGQTSGPSSTNGPAITLEGVSKRFGGSGKVLALDNVNLEVPQGTVFGLLGPNGAGKTTAVRVLTTIITPDSGRATVLGRDVVAKADEVRSYIGLAGQYAAVDENLTGRENLRLIGRLTHLERKRLMSRADELLERFELSDAGDRPARTYSGGMRRRLDLAAALVHQPPVLFLDEPTTGLDPRSRVELWKLIRELVGEGTTLLLTTQYLEEADRLANRISVIDGGRVIAEGTAAELKAGLGTTTVEIGFSHDSEAVRAEPLFARLGSGKPERAGSVVRLDVTEGPRALMGVLGALDREGIVPVSVALSEPSLDDVFFALTGHPAEPTEPKRRQRRQPGRRRGGSSVSTTTTATPAGSTPRSLARNPGPLKRAVGDTMAVAGRNLVTLVRLPQLLVFATIQPVIFVLLFRYAFGGAINTPGLAYVDYLMPGIFAQTVAFGSMGTGVGLAEDLNKGLIERFRSLPMARSAMLAGRILSDLVRNVFVVVLMCAVGFAVSFRIHTNVVAFVGGLVVLLVFGCSLSAIFALVGLSVPNGEAAQAAAFPMLAPLVFASSAFVPVASMPGWLQVFAKHQPVSLVVDAMRALSQGGPTTSYVVQSLIWTVGILAVFGPLAVRRYRRAT